MNFSKKDKKDFLGYQIFDISKEMHNTTHVMSSNLRNLISIVASYDAFKDKRRTYQAWKYQIKILQYFPKALLPYAINKHSSK